MAFEDNERLQELALLATDKVALIGKKWWYALAITVVAIIPAYYLFKLGFGALFMSSYTEPKIIYENTEKQPLQIIEKKIFTQPNNTYSGYVKIRNIEHEWGVASLEYTAVFKTLGGSIIENTKVNRSVFILPSSEKLIVLPRFPSDRKPEELVFTLGPTNFMRKPQIDFDPSQLTLERQTLDNRPDGLVIYAGIKNTTAFTIKEVGLPAIVYDNANEIVGVGYTFINDLLSGETRTFQYSWTSSINGAARAEIKPEINIFDRNIFEVPAGSNPF